MQGEANDGKAQEWDLSILEALVTPQFYGVGMPRMRTRLYFGLPPELSFEMPLPKDATKIGSLIRYSEFQDSLEVVFKTALKADQVNSFYVETLAKRGYSPLETPQARPGRGAFVQSDPDSSDTHRLILCGGSSEPAFSIAIQQGPDATSLYVRVDFDPERSPCGQQRRTRHQIDNLMEDLPQLTLPPGGRLMLRGGGGSDNEAHQDATLDGDVQLSELMQSISDSLEQQGLTVAYSEIGSRIGLIQWESTRDANQRRSGSVSITRSPEESIGYTLSSSIKLDGPRRTGGYGNFMPLSS